MQKSKEEKLANMKAKDMEEFFKFPEGETSFILQAKIPREKEGDFGPQAIFRVEIAGTEPDQNTHRTCYGTKKFIIRQRLI